MLPRVTEILKPLSNYSGIDPKVLETAANRGSRVHLFCEAIARNHFEFLPRAPEPDIERYVQAFQEWFSTTVDFVHSVETRIEDNDLGYTGQIDLVVKLKGDDCLSLVDIKTPATEQRSWCAQLAAYGKLLEGQGIHVKRHLVLKLGREGSFKVIEYHNLEYNWNLFLACLTIFKFMNS